MLDLVRTQLAAFDSVCMATALHCMASLRAPPAEYQALAGDPSFHKLLDTICECTTNLSS